MWEQLYNSGKYLNFELKRSLDNAALFGTALYDIKTSQKLFNKSIKRNNLKKYIEYDHIYYILHKDYGWTIPSKNDIDLILLYSKYTKNIIDIGCGNGFWSKILSHYKPVYPIDDFSEDNTWGRIWIDRINQNVLKEKIDYNNSFIILNYPRIPVIKKIFKEAKIGQRFFIKIPPLAGMPDYIIKWIINSSIILHSNLKCWVCFNFDVTYKYPDVIKQNCGVIIEKKKNIELIEKKYDNKLLLNKKIILSNYTNWIRSYYNNESLKRKLF